MVSKDPEIVSIAQLRERFVHGINQFGLFGRNFWYILSVKLAIMFRTETSEAISITFGMSVASIGSLQKLDNFEVVSIHLEFSWFYCKVI